MPGIPPALDTDTEDVTWALQTAEALWKRNERVDALVWLRRAAQAAGEAEHDDRALELANDGAELAEWLAGHPQPTSASLSAFPLSNVRTNANSVDESRATHPDEVEELSVDVILDSTPSLPRERMDTPMVQHDRTARGRVPSGAEKHAGMLDPWADGDAHISAPGAGHETPSRPPSGSRAPDTDEVVTSAPLIAPAPGRSSVRSTPSRSSGVPSGPKSGVDLSGVDALSDLPDDAREAFARAAVVHQLSRNEEASGFALALILEGSLDLAATILDTPAQRMEAGSVIRSRGTIDHTAPVRLVAASETARVATWDERGVEEAFRTCPWVEDDLRSAGDRLQALVGVTMGPLGERFDPVLRAQVASRLTVLALAEHEVVAALGKPIPGLLIVGAGELELVGADGVPNGMVLRAGDFLFPSEVLLAAPAPSTVRAAKGGALVLFADRRVAQELLVTCPPLLEIFAGT
ncbi:MAG TPA: hypothetical protein VN894_10075 [Polyangiaceae bacterium]|nr:hypothetical protein [Polyangiaceae bacterium]